MQLHQVHLCDIAYTRSGCAIGLPIVYAAHSRDPSSSRRTADAGNDWSDFDVVHNVPIIYGHSTTNPFPPWTTPCHSTANLKRVIVHRYRLLVGNGPLSAIAVACSRLFTSST